MWVYHLATYGGKPNQYDLCRIIQTNFISTVNLIRACKKVNFELFVNTGSSSEYGIKANPMREYDCPEPINNYGVSKCAATLYCQTEAKKEKLPIVTLRLFSPYGNYEESARLIPSVIMACLRGESPRISSPRFVRDFIYIEDVNDSYSRLIDAPDINGQIFNIGSGKSYSIGEVANKIIELTGSRVELLTGREQIWPNEPENWQADISKAKHVLGWKPQYDLEQGLRASIKWFEENIELYNHT
jgi:nucleoside-diphosphate-sugar epimerase